MDVHVTLKLGEAELREISDKWRKIGCELGVDGLHVISANFGKYSERCLSEVLGSWLRNEKNPSWNKLCNALENVGLRSKAEQVREKYCKPSTPDTRVYKGEPENCILLKDRKEKFVEKTFGGLYSKKAEIDISRGELFVQKGDLLYKYGAGSEDFAFKLEPESQDIAPLESVQCDLLKAIPTPKGRITVFMTVGWMDWGAIVKKGDDVYVRVIKDGMEYCSTAVVHYIGTVAGDQPGTLFGVEITDSRYYRCGTCDGTFKGTRYFHCPDNNGLFLSLASVAKQPEWLKLEYHPKRDIPDTSEDIQKETIAPTPVKRNNKEPAQAPARPNMEGNRVNVDTRHLRYGAGVIITTKDGRKIKGTVKWTGELPLEGEDPKKKIPVCGVETDVLITYEHITPAVAFKGRPQLGVSAGHGKVFVPQAMVELGEKVSNTERSTKDVHNEARVDNKGQAALNFEKEKKAAMAEELGPEIAREMDMEEQIKALEEFKKPKQREDNAAPDNGVLAGKEAAMYNEERRQAALKLEKEKAAMAKDLGPEIAGETDIDEQKKALEDFKKPKQREDNAAPDKDVLAGGVSSQYLAVQQNYPYSNSQFDSYTQDPHQYSHLPSVVAQRELGIGSAVIVQYMEPPMCGTIRWIGTIPQVKGYVAGVELETPMDGCTDGVWVQNGLRYFDCPPNKGYFCLLEQLVPTFNNPMIKIPVLVSMAGMANSSLFDKYIGDQKGIQGHQNSCYLDATLFGLFALSSSFDDLFLKVDTEDKHSIEDKQSIEYIIWKKIVNPLRSVGAARYESVMALRERLDELGKMKGITKDEKDPEEFLNMLFKHVLHPEPFIEIRRPFGIEGEFFIQLFLESEANSDADPTISDMIHRMFTEQDLSFTKPPQRLLIQVPRFGKQFKTYKRVIPTMKLNVSKLVHTADDGFCVWCGSPAAWECKECITKDVSDFKMCSSCSERRHKSIKYKGHNPVALSKRADVELDLLSVICIETSHYVCFTRADDKWVFFDSMANRIGDKYNIPCCTNCTDDINEWVYQDPKRLRSSDIKPELVRRFTQDVYMCVYVDQTAGMYM